MAQFQYFSKTWLSITPISKQYFLHRWNTFLNCFKDMISLSLKLITCCKAMSVFWLCTALYYISIKQFLDKPGIIFMTEDFEIVWRIINGQKNQNDSISINSNFLCPSKKICTTLLCIITWYHGKEKLIHVINYVLLLSEYLGKQCFIVLIKILVIIGNRKWWCFYENILSKKKF